MSTRSRITIALPDQPKKSIYCHSDGYPDRMLPLLRKNYDTPEKVKELISLGDLSSLDDTPGRCYAYHRDGGEPKEFTDSPQQYNYLFDGEGKLWHLTGNNHEF